MRRFLLVAFVALGLANGGAVYGQVEGPQPTHVLVRAEVKGGPEAPRVESQQVKVKFGDHAREVTGWEPVLSGPDGKGTGVQLALLIDDGLGSDFGRMLGEMQSFVQALPPDVEVLVGYMQNGRVVMKQDFTSEHDAAAKSLRLTMGSPGVSASPYFCLSEFVKGWAPNGKAHVVLMVTSGVDPYNGSTSIMNQNSPYVETAMRDAQRAGTQVYSIYFTGAGQRSFRSSFSGQSYLTQVAAGTGGRAYYLGTGNPPTFAPFLRQFNEALAETYRLSFLAGGKGLQQLKVTVDGAKVTAPMAALAGR